MTPPRWLLEDPTWRSCQANHVEGTNQIDFVGFLRQVMGSAVAVDGTTNRTNTCTVTAMRRAPWLLPQQLPRLHRPEGNVGFHERRNRPAHLPGLTFFFVQVHHHHAETRQALGGCFTEAGYAAGYNCRYILDNRIALLFRFMQVFQCVIWQRSRPGAT